MFLAGTSLPLPSWITIRLLVLISSRISLLVECLKVFFCLFFRCIRGFRKQPQLLQVQMGKWLPQWCAIQDGTDLLILRRRGCYFDSKGKLSHFGNRPDTLFNHQRLNWSTVSILNPWRCWLFPPLGNVSAKPDPFALRERPSRVSLLLLAMQVRGRWRTLRGVCQAVVLGTGWDRKALGKDSPRNREKALINEKQNSLILCIHLPCYLNCR